MKSHLMAFLGLGAMTALGLNAADLKLTDGRVYPEFRIVSQTPTAVIVRYQGGAAKVEKRLLPPEVLAQYPIDEKAAVAAAQREQADAAARSENARRADETKKQENEMPRRISREEFMAQQAARGGQTDLQATVERIVYDRAEMFFTTERQAPSTALTLELQIRIQHVRPVDGWTNRFDVTGVAWWQSVASKGGFMGGRSWFRVDVRPDGNGRLRVAEFRALDQEPL